MLTKNIFKKRYTNFLLSLVVSLFSITIFLLTIYSGFFQSINNIFTDALQGEVEARKEIVIVGIDDQSLQEIGSWPWNRDVFAQTLENISNQNPTVIGIDILFLESREGDEALISQLNSDQQSPVILGSKLVDNDLYRSILEINVNNPKVKSGFVNFQPDPDGKIRKTIAWKDTGTDLILSETAICELSFSLQIVRTYLKLEDTEVGNNWDSLCTQEINLRSNTVKLDSNQEVNFAYTKQDFESIPFKDVYNGNFKEDYFKNKIVLIGSTAIDLRTNLNDNFTSIFGETIPGIEIHANIINSFLNETFYYYPNTLISGITLFIINLVLAYIYFRLKKISYTSIILISTVVTVVLIGAIAINFNYLFNTIQILLSFLITYVVAVLIKYSIQNREARYIKGAFSRYLNPHLLNILLTDTEKLTLGGETKNMSVLFSDIRGFTTISEKMSPEELINMINDYLNFMSDIILRNNGTIDKYIGDAIMAFWNAPIDDLNHARNAITSAIEMKDSLEEFKRTYPQYPEINIGIGINSGNMTVGNVGGKDRFDYTVLGDNVNLGSRLEGLTKKYGVTTIVSESTYNEYLIQSAKVKKESIPENILDNTNEDNLDNSIVIFRLLDDVIVKGKESSIKIYEPMKDTEENRSIKEIYESAFKKYQDGKFKEARILLQSIESKDPATNKLIERIELLEKETPKDWNGIWKWEEK